MEGEGAYHISAPQGLRLQNGSRTYAFGGKWGARKLVNPVSFNLPLHLHAPQDTLQIHRHTANQQQWKTRGVAEASQRIKVSSVLGGCM